ncbi:1,2-phenylacetyl-CoA epoxidase subunit PaaE [Sphaerisporangium corydalis]|uniref:1,2-phenylacetyl-CoA epoxidase subunit PaaE n=1 Tax=Sphaerisporangium corydalis TaxID=1441875 RepID=A0ABV9EAR8_9ACTN|nr:1,2-phenylacetyl-CoA epoxidase subunit PaaE [Sphaerisporangium corydalis]
MSVRPVEVRVRGRRGFRSLEVARVDRLCEDATAITFDVPEELAEEFAFLPGQSVTIRTLDGGRDERRSYSICAPAGGPLRIGVREIPGGLFSTRLVRTLRPGDRLDVLPPSGGFTADLGRPEHHVFVAAGSGITPVLSLASSVLAATPGSRVTLFYGNRTTRTVMFAEELADLKDVAPARVELVHVLSREPREPELFTGRLDAAKLRVLLPALTAVPEVGHWWLCGPYAMVLDARQVLAELGVPAERVHNELFYVDEPPPVPVRAEHAGEEVSAEVTVILDGRATSAPLPSGVTVLEAAQRVRPDLPFACKGGVCGTCRARLVGGKVEMRRNFALEPAEVAAGYVLTCQSDAVSEKVVVDFDT